MGAQGKDADGDQSRGYELGDSVAGAGDAERDGTASPRARATGIGPRVPSDPEVTAAILDTMKCVDGPSGGPFLSPPFPPRVGCYIVLVWAASLLLSKRENQWPAAAFRIAID